MVRLRYDPQVKLPSSAGRSTDARIQLPAIQDTLPRSDWNVKHGPHDDGSGIMLQTNTSSSDKWCIQVRY